MTRLDADKHIIAAVDTTELTLDAVHLAKLLGHTIGAPVDVVSVFPYVPLGDPSGEELTDVREEARTILRELANASGLEAANIETSPAIGPRGSSSDLASGTCPIALAPRGYAERLPMNLERVGVAFDGSEEADGALEAARALVRASGAQLRIISVFEPMTFGALATGRAGGALVNERLRAELRSALDVAVTGALNEDAPEGRFLEGSAAEILSAESSELDLLVTGSRRYGPRKAVLLGGTTHALMRSAACPLLVVPRGATE